MFKIDQNVTIDVFHVGSEYPLLMERITGKNLVVNAGLNIIRNVLAQPDSAIRQSFLRVYFHWGSGTTAPGATQTALITPGAGDPQVITEANDGTNYQITYKYYMPSGTANGEDLKEAGLFFGNTAGDNTLFSRVLIDPFIAKTVDKAITFTWVHTITAS